MSDEKKTRGPITITVDIDDAIFMPDHNGEGDTFVEEVARRATLELLRRVKPATIEDIRKEVLASVKGTVEAECGVIVREVLASQIRRTNTYGEPIGEPISFRDHIAGLAKSFLEERVDSDGRPNGYSDQMKPRVRWFIDRAVAEVTKNDLTKAIGEAVAEVKKGLTGNMTRMLAEAVNTLLGAKVAA